MFSQLRLWDQCLPHQGCFIGFSRMQMTVLLPDNLLELGPNGAFISCLRQILVLNSERAEVSCQLFVWPPGESVAFSPSPFPWVRPLFHFSCQTWTGMSNSFGSEMGRVAGKVWVLSATLITLTFQCLCHFLKHFAHFRSDILHMIHVASQFFKFCDLWDRQRARSSPGWTQHSKFQPGGTSRNVGISKGRKHIRPSLQSQQEANNKIRRQTLDEA